MRSYIETVIDNFREGLNGETGKNRTYRGIDDPSLTSDEENSLYAAANKELNSPERDEGIWAKALAKGGSNPEGKYIEFRFEAMKAELLRMKQELCRAAKRQAEREKAEREAREKIEKAEYEARIKAEREARERRSLIRTLVVGGTVILLLVGLSNGWFR